MLERFQARNYQKHRLKRLVFDRRVTTLVGPSDSGKSSLIRALRWVCTNKPRGTADITQGESSAVGTLWVDGHKIIRKQGITNVYSLDDKSFKAFASDVPDEIKQLLNVDTVNFQTQLEAHWWFTDTGSQISKNLNSIINLDVIDSTLARLVADQRVNKSVIAVSQARLDTARTNAKELRYVVKMGKDWDAVEQLYTDADAKRTRLTQIATIVDDIQSTVLIQERASGAILDGQQVLKLGAKAADSRNRVNDLQNVIAEIKATVDNMNETVAEITKLKKQMGNKCPTCGKPIK